MRRFIGTCILLLMVATTARAQGAGRGKSKARDAEAGDVKLVGALIDHAIAIGWESDPLKKAARFEQTAGVLADAAENAAGKGRHDRAGRFAEQFAQVAEKGVSANLDKAQHEGAKGLENALQRHTERMSRHEQVFQRVLAKAPEAARKGLLRAIEVSRRGRLRSLEHLRENLARRQARQKEKSHGGGRGKDKPEKAGRGRDKAGGGGPPEEKGNPDHKGKGRPEEVSRGRGRSKPGGGGSGGPPEGKGKPGNKGRGKGKPF